MFMPNLLYYSSIDGHFVYFYPVTVMNSAVMNVDVLFYFIWKLKLLSQIFLLGKIVKNMPNIFWIYIFNVATFLKKVTPLYLLIYFSLNKDRSIQFAMWEDSQQVPFLWHKQHLTLPLKKVYNTMMIINNSIYFQKARRKDIYICHKYV